MHRWGTKRPQKQDSGRVIKLAVHALVCQRRRIARPRSLTNGTAMTAHISEADFRRTMGHLASGVSVITTRDAQGAPVGFTASAVTSLSLEPPLMLVCVDRRGHTLSAISHAGCFAVHVLRDDQADLAMRFASSSRDDRFSGLDLVSGMTSAPCLVEAHARIECRLEACHDGGDHVIVVGEVVAAEALGGLPLLYWRGQLGTPTVPEVEAQSTADGGST